jgi:hypothetical protein
MSLANISSANADALVGSWQLERFTVHCPDGHVAEPLGDRPRGIITYGADGAMSVHLVKRGAVTGLTVMQGYTAYFGGYVVNLDQGIITHHIEESTLDILTGTQQERSFKREGDVLILTTVQSTGTTELRWRRYKPVTPFKLVNG